MSTQEAEVTEKELTPEELAQLPVDSVEPIDVELEEDYNVDVENTEPPTEDVPEHKPPKRPQDVAHEVGTVAEQRSVADAVS